LHRTWGSADASVLVAKLRTVRGPTTEADVTVLVCEAGGDIASAVCVGSQLAAMVPLNCAWIVGKVSR
jgi:hypothetical protein